MQTLEEIYKEMVESYGEKTGVELREGGDMSVRLMAAAAQIQALQVYLDWLQDQAFPQTATGEALDRHGQMRGLTRNEAQKAKGEIRFYLPAAGENPMEVPAGTLCLTAGLVAFVTLEAGSIPAGETSCLVPAEAQEAGAAGNVPAGAIRVLSLAPNGVSACVNEQAFSGGCDQEADTDFRQRILDSYASLPNGTNAAFYESEAMQFPGVAAVLVKPRAHGPGTVELCISSQEGLPTEALLEEISDHLNQLREICVDVSVVAPEPVEVDINLKLKGKPGVEFAAASAQVRQALENYFDGRRFGKDLLLAELGQVVYTAGDVENYSFLEPEADRPMLENQLPCLGQLTIQEWS